MVLQRGRWCGICGTVAINSVKDADIVMSTGEMQKEMLTVRLWLRRKISICLYGRIRTEVLKFRPELLFIPVLLPIFLLKIEDADVWRTEAWEMIRQRSDLHFLMITKRINRVMECLPVDWKDGYDNVTICCTVENQLCADNRLPVYRAIPIKHKIIICEPLLEEISLDAYNIGEWVEQVVAGGESGYEARICNFDWIMKLHDICVKNNVSFWFKQTGSKFVKEGTLYTVKRQFQHSQAHKAGINFK